jgi:hypothetical protein
MESGGCVFNPTLRRPACPRPCTSANTVAVKRVGQAWAHRGTMLRFMGVLVAYDGPSCPRKCQLHASSKGASLRASRRITDADRRSERSAHPLLACGRAKPHAKFTQRPKVFKRAGSRLVTSQEMPADYIASQRCACVGFRVARVCLPPRWPATTAQAASRDEGSIVWRKPSNPPEVRHVRTHPRIIDAQQGSMSWVETRSGQIRSRNPCGLDSHSEFAAPVCER